MKSFILGGLALLIVSACDQARRQEHHAQSDDGSMATPAPPVLEIPYESPFTRTTFESAAETCLSIRVEPRPGYFPELHVVNRCDYYAIALLTSPLEVRVRQTGAEKFVYERMSWAVYAILYVVSGDLGDRAFRGDGVIRDGRLHVRRPPGYTTLGPRASVTIPLRCQLSVPPGDYVLSLSTFEAPLGDAPPRADPLDCGQSVERWNEGRSDADLSLSHGASQVDSLSPIVKLGT